MLLLLQFIRSISLSREVMLIVFFVLSNLSFIFSQCNNPPNCISNPGVESNSGISGNLGTQVQVPGWFVAYGDPSMFSNGGVGGTYGLWMWSYNGHRGVGEGAYTCFRFQAGKSYRVSIDVKCDNAPGSKGYDNGTLYVQATNGNFGRPTNSGSQVIFAGNFNNPVYTTLTFTYVPSSNYNRLWLFPYMPLPATTAADQYQLIFDNIFVCEILTPSVNPVATTIDQGSSTTLIASINPLPSPAGVWTWSPQAGIISTSPDGSSITVSPCQTTTYTARYSLCTSCNYTVSSVITVNSPHVIEPTISGNNPICSGNSTTLTATGYPTYTWSPAESLSSANGSIVIASPTINTTYTVDYGTGRCANSFSYTVNVHHTPTASFTYTEVCFGDALHMLANSNGNPMTNHQWDFLSDGNIDITGIANPSYVFPTFGSHSVSHSVTSTPTIGLTCTNFTTQHVWVNPKPIADFSAINRCTNEQPNAFDASSSQISIGTNTAYVWSFADGISFSSLTPLTTHSYALSGSYNVSLTVNSDKGCQTSITKPVEVYQIPVITILNSNTCDAQVMSFSATAQPNSGNVVKWWWDFDDNLATVEKTDQITGFIFPTPGAHTVNLIAETGKGCKDTVNKSINVYVLPTASFTFTEACFGDALQMMASSNDNTITNHQWDFLSDGNIDITGIANPSYLFPTLGSHSVSYSVTSTPTIGLTCTSFTTQHVWVNPKPIADFSAINRCVNEQPNTFDASSSQISIGTNTAYVWFFADGTSFSSLTPIATHSYALSGSYNVSLTVNSDKGCQTSITKPIEVYQIPLIHILNSNACDAQVMSFSATAQPNSGHVVKWWWDFDGNLASVERTDQITGFVFPTPGAHTVNLIAETDKGCKDTVNKSIVVNDVPKPLFSVNTPSGCPLPHCVTFTDHTLPISGSSTNANWKWVFGDGTVVNSSSNVDQSHCYLNHSANQSALFDVKLIVTTDKGCEGATEIPSMITVYPKPLARYTANATTEDVVTPFVYFINESQGFTKWWWSFGDSPSKDSLLINPTHFYTNMSAGLYPSVLIVSNQYGCKDTTSLTISIQPGFTFYLPNAFTPGDPDGINDVFTGKGIGITEYEMRIFNRWGENIFMTRDMSKGWDGLTAIGAEAKQDVYVWKVRLKDVLNKIHDYVGYVTLLR